MEIENTPNGHKLLDVIRIIAFHGESGRLQMTVGSTQGVFFFTNGRLVDANLGSLNGFQAINAAVSMLDAHFSFVPSISPPLSSSITPTERTILKQFFDIETADPDCDHYVRVTDPIWDMTPAQVVPLNDVHDSVAQPDENEIRASINEEAPGLEDNVEQDIREPEKLAEVPLLPGFQSSASKHRAGLYLTILVIFMVVSVVALVTIRSDQRSSTVARQNEPSVDARSDQPVPAEQSAPVVVRNGESSKQSKQSGAVAQDLTGEWKIVNTIQKTAYRSFNNLEVGFRLVINQTGNQFTAKGEKVSENGRSLPASGRTPIQVTGSIEGDRVQATFFEEGAVRKTNGRFVWRIERMGSGLAGTFFSTAAKSSGKSAATREL